MENLPSIKSDSELEVISCYEMLKENKANNPFSFLQWDCPAKSSKIFDLSLLHKVA